MSEPVLLEIRNVSKNFGVTQALSDVSLVVEKGTVHSLLGRNGAGKSTLVNIIAGLYPQTSGTVVFEGKDIKELNIFERQTLGIKLVPQHENIIPHLSIAENIFLGILPVKGNRLVDWKTMNELADKELKKYGLDVDPTMEARKLSSVDTRKLNIIRAMYGGAKLIILDEPTTALSNKERNELFAFVNELKAKGTAFIFISHYLHEVINLSDDITVVRDGKAYRGIEDGVEANEEYLSRLIAGEDVVVTKREIKYDYKPEDMVLRCTNLCGESIDDVSFEIFKGEIVGFIGLPGSGSRETCRALFGLNKLESGEILYNNEKITVKTPGEALQHGIAYISHDRHREGLLPLFTINENIGTIVMNKQLKRPMGMIDKKGEREISEKYKDILNIKCNSIDDQISSLSGGNQQKVVVGKYLSSEPQLLILDEPTIGIDIKSREEIIGTVNDMTKHGVAVIYLTNDFEELLRVADKLIFFKNFKIVAMVDNKDLSIEGVTQLRDNVIA
ncbi:MAG: sugar ABC transporter ATP-binding protein [Christensenella sp.]